MSSKSALLAAAAVLAAATAARADVTGDAAKAAPIVGTVCIACHGADGNPPVQMFPRLAGQNPDYVLKQLKDFKSEKRQSDVMAPVVAKLSEDDMANLAAFFSGQKVAAPDTDGDPALITKGKKLFDEGNTDSGVPACAGCHGPTGSGSSMYPRIATQHIDYARGQLKAFGAGQRKNDKHLMQAVASRLSDDEVTAVTTYLASMP